MASTIVSLSVPFAYISLLCGSLLIFSRIHRARNEARIANQEPWFPSHHERDVYISLLQLNPPPSDILLKAALLKRAVTDVQRIQQFREDKTALQTLLTKGSIGDDLWNAFLAAEKELEAEIMEVVGEANAYKEGWGQFIFQSASEMVNSIKYRDIVMQTSRLKAEAEAKYGQKRLEPAKSLVSSLAVPSPQTSLPASPGLKATIPTTRIPSQTGPSVSPKAQPTTPSAARTTLSNGGSTGPPSTTSSPMSQTSNLPKTGGKRNRKRK